MVLIINPVEGVTMATVVLIMNHVVHDAFIEFDNGHLLSSSSLFRLKVQRNTYRKSLCLLLCLKSDLEREQEMSKDSGI